MKKRLKNVIQNLILPLAAILLFFLIWFLVAKEKNNALVLPYPKEVLSRFFTLFQEKTFFKAVFNTLGRTFLCFAVSFAAALVFSVLAEVLPPAASFLAPIVSFLRAAPTVAVILILYAFLPAKTMSVVVGFLIGFPVLYSAFKSALSSVDKKTVLMAKVYKVNLFRRIIEVYIPSVLPSILDASRSTLSLLLKVVVAAEILTLVPNCLGGKIQTAYASFEISYLLAWTLVAILLSYLIEILVFLVKKAIVRWQ